MTGVNWSTTGTPNINVQHLVALTLVDGGLTFDSSHDHARMDDPRVLEVRRKIELKPNAQLTTALPPRQVIMTAQLQNGQSHRHHAKAVRGTPDDPMNRSEVVAKAIDLMAPILGLSQATQLAEHVMQLEKMPEAGALMGGLLAA